MARPKFTFLAVLALVLLQASLSSAAQTTLTPEPTCSIVHTTVDCSNLGLTGVPHRYIPHNITTFILHNNNITAVESEDFTKYTNLTHIDLSWNRISNISQRAFKGLESLRMLNLSFNMIDDENVEETRLFDGLISLEWLDLSHNALGIQLKFYLFSGLQSLKALNLSHNNLTTSDEPHSCFLILPKLTRLDLSANAIHQLHNHTFSQLFTVQWLSLASNSIPLAAFAYPQGVFKSLKASLTHLHLEGNCNATEERAGGSLDYPHEALSHLRSLTSLYLDGIPNAAFGPGFSRMVSLSLLSLSGLGDGFCYMNAVASETLKNLPGSLRILILSHCNLNAIEPTAFRPLSRSLQVLDVSSNEALGFDRLGEGLYGLQNSVLKELHINHIAQVCSLNALVTPHNTRYLRNINITAIYAQNNSLHFFCVGARENLPRTLVHVDLNNNLLTCWLGGDGRLRQSSLGLPELRSLDLSTNFAHAFDYEFFMAYPNLRTFNGSNNFLRKFLHEDTYGNFFAPLQHLEELVLQWTYTNKLPTRIFQGLSSLRILDLSHNEMGQFEVNISHMQNLTLLNLSDNSIDFLPQPITDHLDALAAAGRHIEVDLTFNRLTCVCRKLGFLTWIQNTRVRFAKYGTYTCRLSDGTITTLQKKEFLDFIVKLQANCSGSGLLVLAGAGCFCLLTAILSAVAYRYRWKLRYLYYITRLAYTKLNTQQNDNFQYDAFVSYASEDSEFVHRQLIGELETRAGLRLNIHNRDFTPGRPITCNIVDAIQSSRRTLVVLSRQLLRSDWCIFELQMAMMEAAHTGRDVTIFLLYEELRNEEIPRKVFYYLQISTFLTYPGDAGDQESLDHFWRRLVLAIKQT